MRLQTPKPLTEPEAVCTGFVRIIANPGPDTLRVTIQRPENETVFALSPDECSQWAAILLRYTATRGDGGKQDGSTIAYSEFTKEMHTLAASEGWCLSERSDGYLEIQRCDDDPQERFATDLEAVDHVSRKAREGSYPHQLAMHLDGTQYAVW